MLRHEVSCSTTSVGHRETASATLSSVMSGQCCSGSESGGVSTEGVSGNGGQICMCQKVWVKPLPPHTQTPTGQPEQRLILLAYCSHTSHTSHTFHTSPVPTHLQVQPLQHSKPGPKRNAPLARRCRCCRRRPLRRLALLLLQPLLLQLVCERCGKCGKCEGCGGRS